MTAATLASTGVVTVERDRITIRDLVVVHGESAALVRTQLESDGVDAATDLIRRAIPIGLVSLSLSTAGMDTGSIQRTLDDFASTIDARSAAALAGLDHTLTRLQAGEQTVLDVAQSALAQLPSRLDQVLGGEAGNVRAAVLTATRDAQAAALNEVRAALAQHARDVRQSLSLDGDGPVQALRRDILGQIAGTRQELTEQLTAVRGALEAAEAHRTATMKSSRAIGATNEDAAMALAEQVITAAGDLWETTGSSPAPGGTSRAGDGVATLTAAISGRTPVRLVVEAKHRSRPLTAKQWRDNLREGRTVRQAAGALGIAPTAEQVPGGGSFARVDDLSFVVSAEDPQQVSLVYLVLRELTALVAVKDRDGDAELDLQKIEAGIALALSGLSEFDEVARLANSATKNLENLKATGVRVKQRIQEALTSSLTALRH